MYLLDTDTFVFFLRGHQSVVDAMGAHEADPKALSIVSYGELLYGAEKSASPTENAAKVRRVGELCPVIEISLPVIETFAALKASLESGGARLDDFDLLIAATALTVNYTLVTNNEKHFSRIAGLPVENWTRKK